jgi:glutathione S-transferase
MSDEIAFYTNPMSRGQIVRWMLEEVGAPHRQVILDYASSMKGEDYLKINPMGKVPAIVHHGSVVTECAAICAYLAHAFPEAKLTPEPDAIADYCRWLFFTAGPVEQAITDRSLKVEPTEDQQRMVGYGSYERVIDVLESAVAGKAFVAGNRFTAADVYVGSHIIWGTQFGTMPKRDAFTAYIEPLMARAAYLKAKAIDDALIAEIQAEQPA